MAAQSGTILSRDVPSDEFSRTPVGNEGHQKALPSGHIARARLGNDGLGNRGHACVQSLACAQADPHRFLAEHPHEGGMECAGEKSPAACGILPRDPRGTAGKGCQRSVHPPVRHKIPHFATVSGGKDILRRCRLPAQDRPR